MGVIEGCPEGRGVVARWFVDRRSWQHGRVVVGEIRDRQQKGEETSVKGQHNLWRLPTQVACLPWEADPTGSANGARLERLRFDVLKRAYFIL